MRAIGIDLGTTNSVAAVDNGNERRILSPNPNEDFTPSVVSFSQGTLLVGRLAWNNAAVAPKDTIFSIKRLMGRSFDDFADKEVAEFRQHYSYSIIATDDPNDRGIRVLAGGGKYTPEDISAMILRQVAGDASHALGEQVTHAVITVPAYFSEPQREATRTAGEQAGLVIKKIIDEPTAAAIAFGIDLNQAQRVFVFDMGGGTLDVSILHIHNREFLGIAHAGDMWLGGDDFDTAIVEMIVERVVQDYSIDRTVIEGDDRFRVEARRKAEAIKRLLTRQPEADLVIPAIVPLSGDQRAQVAMTISQDAFEKRIGSLVEKGRKLIQEVLKSAKMTPKLISTVLLVGGSTYVPLVRRMLAEEFGEEKIQHSVNPMHAVALGAAILAEQLEGIVCPNVDCGQTNPYDVKNCKICGASLSTARVTGGVGLNEVTERHLGICVVDKQKGPDVFSVLIEKGTPYPLAQPKQQRYLTTSHQITIPVYVGMEPVASQNEYLGLVEYTLPSDLPPRTPVTVQFNYDRDRILKVRIEVEGRNISYETTPKRHTPDPNKVGDDKWRTVLQNVIAFAQMMIERYSDFIEPGKRQPLEDQMRLTRQALADQDQSAGQRILNELLETVGNLGVASHLLVVDRLMREVDPKTSQWLAEQSKGLRDAYRTSDAARVTQIKNALEITMKQISDSTPMGPEIKAYDGLLEYIAKERT